MQASATEASLCVFCGKELLRGRMLKCLHNLCLRCVQDVVGDNNAITCPRCASVTAPCKLGSTQLQSLPNCYNIVRRKRSLSERDHLQVQCDECDTDSDMAEHVCADCGLHLCGVHSAAHQKGKRTRHHKTLPVSREHSEIASPVQKKKLS